MAVTSRNLRTSAAQRSPRALNTPTPKVQRVAHPRSSSILIYATNPAIYHCVD